VGLTVACLENAVRFYGGVLDGTLLERAEIEGADSALITGLEGSRVVCADLLLPNGVLLELIQYVSPQCLPLTQQRCAPGHTHIAFCVSDADAAYAKVGLFGGRAQSLPVLLRYPGSEWDGMRVFYALDPDGRTIEFVQAP